MRDKNKRRNSGQKNDIGVLSCVLSCVFVVCCRVCCRVCCCAFCVCWTALRQTPPPPDPPVLCVCVCCVCVCLCLCLLCVSGLRFVVLPRTPDRPSARPPKISLFFFRLPAPIFIHSSLSWGLIVEFWWCF